MFSFIIVRYSVWTPSGGAYATARRVGLDRYKDTLFSRERMERREWLFEHVVLNSLAQQKPALNPDTTRVLVMTSDQLPYGHRARLDRMLADHPWAEALAVRDGAHMREVMAERIGEVLRERFPGQSRIPYATLRLDDDDAVSRDFMKRIGKRVAEPYVGMCVSLGRGFSGWVDEDGRYTAFRELVFPNIAIGLAYIGAYDARRRTFLARYPTIYSLMRHTDVHLKAPTILSCKKPAFVRTLYPGQDSESAGKKLYRVGKAMSPVDVDRHVPLAGTMLTNFIGPRSGGAASSPDHGSLSAAQV